jgi:hypothetical protein
VRVDPLDQIIERRIAEAQSRGDFDDLPGAGQPLALDDDSLVPLELRAAYRLLRNAGYVPEEVQLLRELGSVEQLIAQAVDESDRAAASARLRYLLDRLGADRRASMQWQADYFQRVIARLEERR